MNRFAYQKGGQICLGVALLYFLFITMVASFTPLLLRQTKHLPSNRNLYRSQSCRPAFGAFLNTILNMPTTNMGTRRLVQYNSKSDVETTLTDSNIVNNNVIPRAAVSVLVRHLSLEESTTSDEGTIYYALVQRGKEPNKGMWSFPGGSIETGEFTLEAAKRELWEETGLKHESLDWYETGPITCSDSIIFDDDNGQVRFHYVISQCFAQTKYQDKKSMTSAPILTASDDAADAKWWILPDIKKGVNDGIITAGVERVISRAEKLHRAGLLIK